MFTDVSANATTDDTEKERATRSLGKISKLLFGGTYVMVQLGKKKTDYSSGCMVGMLY